MSDHYDRLDLVEYLDLDEVLRTGQCDVTAKNMAALILALEYLSAELEELKKKMKIQ